MIPKKLAPDLIGGGNRFSEKHALGLDPRDHVLLRESCPVNIAILRDDCDVAVLGAGPYGLAIAAHLKAAQIVTRVAALRPRNLQVA